MGVTVTVGEQDAYLARVGRAGMLLLPMITGYKAVRLGVRLPAQMGALWALVLFGAAPY